MANGHRTRILSSLSKVPRGWFWLAAFLLSGLMWLGILWLGSLLFQAMASECANPKHPEQFLPPREYRAEPNQPFVRVEAETLNLFRFGTAKGGGQVLGYYLQATGKIWICKGLTGDALRIIRMHEEAHAKGWRH